MPLKTTNTIPAGGWWYTQLNAEGNPLRTFHDFGTFTMFCQSVLGCRQGNILPRATMPDVQQDVDEAQCVRLGGDPQWCSGGPYAAPPRTVSSCAGCGGKPA